MNNRYTLLASSVSSVDKEEKRSDLNENKNSNQLSEPFKTKKMTDFNYQIHQDRIEMIQSKLECLKETFPHDKIQYEQFRVEMHADLIEQGIFAKEFAENKEIKNAQQVLNFEVVCQDRNFFIFSDDVSYLDHTLDTLIAYTKNVSPHSSVSEKVIHTTLEEKKKELNLGSHYICANDFLPSWLYEYSTLEKHKTWDSSCFGFARLASGLAPIANEYYNLNGMEYETVQTGNLLPGDFIEVGFNKHGFIYLNQDICLSANGRARPLHLCLLQDVLSLYGFPDTDLKPSNEVTIIRKKANFNFPDNIRKCLMEIIQKNRGIIDSVIQKNVEPAAMELCRFVLTDNSEPAKAMLNNFSIIVSAKRTAPTNIN